MKIAVYGATGNVGSAIVAEAVARGHQVTGISRRPGAGSDVTWLTGDAGDAAFAAELAAGHDVVVSAIGPSREPGADGQPFLDALKNLIDHAGSARLLVVGGASSLQVAPGMRLFDSPEFPEEYKSEALWGIRGLDLVRSAPATVSWTYLSPAPEIGPGERTGKYVVALEEPAGWTISYADYAVALVDEIDTPQHVRERFTAAN